MCLVIPSEVIPGLALINGPDYELHFRPAGTDRAGRLDRCRVPLESLMLTIDDIPNQLSSRSAAKPTGDLIP
jgi:hypothetical protein